jgi:hypothetical protein
MTLPTLSVDRTHTLKHCFTSRTECVIIIKDDNNQQIGGKVTTPTVGFTEKL